MHLVVVTDHLARSVRQLDLQHEVQLNVDILLDRRLLDLESRCRSVGHLDLVVVDFNGDRLEAQVLGHVSFAVMSCSLGIKLLMWKQV